MHVPLLDLKPQYSEIKDDLKPLIDDIFESQWFVLGKNVTALEEEMANYSGTRHGVGVASGSDALLLSMMCLGIGRGDKVITTPFTFFATAGCIYRLGAEPILVDIERDSFNMDPERLDEYLDEHKERGDHKALIPVHLYGQCADMDTLNGVAECHGLKVIEDAAQAVGAEYKSKRAGSLGDFGCLSFYPTKNLGGAGDGGMIVTDDRNYMERLKLLRDHGARKRYYYETVGMNSRLDELQAAFLRTKLKHLDRWLEERRRNADYYNRRLSEVEEVVPPITADFNVHTYHQYIIRAGDRDGLKRHLDEHGVGNALFYPLALHEQKCFAGLGYEKGDFPEAERAAAETIALPIFNGLTREQQDYVIDSIKEYYR